MPESKDETSHLESVENSEGKIVSKGNEETNTEEISQIVSEIPEFSEEETYSEEEVGRYILIRNVLLGVALAIILACVFALFYRFYPLPVKVAGEWHASTVNGDYIIHNKDDESRFIMKNLNGVSGIDLVFKSKLVSEGQNEYFVEKTEPYLELSHDYLSTENITEIVGDNGYFIEVSDNGKIKTLKYTKKGIDANFGKEDLDKWFKYVLREFDKTLQGKAISLRNATFASGGITFYRAENE